MNIYVTSESAAKIQSLITNIKNFYILDIQAFISEFHLDLTKPTNVYFVNNEISNRILSVSKLKKYQGIIYINNKLSESLYYSLKKRFGNDEHIDKFVLIDNGNVPKHKDLHSVFEEVFFFERFKKNKIVECNGVMPADTSLMNRFDNSINNMIDLNKLRKHHIKSHTS